LSQTDGNILLFLIFGIPTLALYGFVLIFSALSVRNIGRNNVRATLYFLISACPIAYYAAAYSKTKIDADSINKPPEWQNSSPGQLPVPRSLLLVGSPMIDMKNAASIIVETTAIETVYTKELERDEIIAYRMTPSVTCQNNFLSDRTAFYRNKDRAYVLAYNGFLYCSEVVRVNMPQSTPSLIRSNSPLSSNNIETRGNLFEYRANSDTKVPPLARRDTRYEMPVNFPPILTIGGFLRTEPPNAFRYRPNDLIAAASQLFEREIGYRNAHPRRLVSDADIEASVQRLLSRPNLEALGLASVLIGAIRNDRLADQLIDRLIAMPQGLDAIAKFRSGSKIGCEMHRPYHRHRDRLDRLIPKPGGFVETLASLSDHCARQMGQRY